MELIQGSNLDKVYSTATGPLVALTNVSFTVNEGEFISLVGPSGCGKSTLLSILGGLEQKTDGELVLAGQHHDAPRRDIGMMFQTSVLFPWRTIRQNVRLPGEILGLDRSSRPSGPTNCLIWWASTALANAIPANSPAACASASPWRACWRTIRACC